MIPEKLSDSALLEKTQDLVARERELTTEILHHLREIERRRLFAARGFPSLFDYCVRGLGYSESAAQRRISSMRLLKEMPEVEEKIREGALSLSVVAQAQSFFKQEGLKLDAKREVLKALEGKSTREAERELLSRSSLPAPEVKERARAISEKLTEIRFVANEELMDQLEKIKGLLAHTYPDIGWGELIALLAKMGLEKLDPAREPARPRKSLPAPALTRAIPAAVRREVFKRDDSRCTFKDPKTGRVCGSRYRLQLDHRKPFTLGGPSTVENLRVLCFHHNQWEAGRLGLLNPNSRLKPVRTSHSQLPEDSLPPFAANSSSPS